MSPSFELVRLACPSCGAPLAGEGEDVLFYCTACRSGYCLGEERRTLLPLEVRFVSLPAGVAERYLPFWLLPARLHLDERLAAGGQVRRMLSLFTGGGGDDPSSWNGTFAIPAFETSLRQALHLARRYTEGYPTLDQRLGERLVGGCYKVSDAEKLAHFTVISLEADKPDTLESLRYRLHFGEPSLLGVPFLRRGDALVDAVYGLRAF